MRLIAALLFALLCSNLLAGCASQQPSQAVSDFAAEAAKLGEFSALTTRYRDTYQREQPYLTAAADARERPVDAGRRGAAADFASVGHGVALYMQTLARLADGGTYDFSPQIKDTATAIKAWPDSGLNSGHVNAYSRLAQLLARVATRPYQEKAVRQLLTEGGAAAQDLLDAMIVLVRNYDNSNDDERKIVLGYFEAAIPFADTPKDRLLSTLAKAHQQDKTAEYSVAGRRYALLQTRLATIAQGHRQLLADTEHLDDGTTQAALRQGAVQLRDNSAEAGALAY